MSKLERLEELADLYRVTRDSHDQSAILREFAMKASYLKVDGRAILLSPASKNVVAEGIDAQVKCPDCERIFGNERGLMAHKGRMHKTERRSKSFRK
jgi:hypothetical protein